MDAIPPATGTPAGSADQGAVEGARSPAQILAMNEALLLGALRQHELTEEAETLNAQLRAEVVQHRLARLEIERLNANLELRVAQRTEALLAATREAERANAAKSEFLSRTSHELRTPMNAILGFGQLLEMDTLNESQAESVWHILTAGRHLLKLINEVLDLAHAESGRAEISLEMVDVAELVDETVCLIRPLATGRGIQVDVRPPPPDARSDHRLRVSADRRLLEQVLLNLLGNAVKYNVPGGRVVLDYASGGGCLRLRVADTGPGIPAHRRARLFTPFDRLGAEHGSIEGSGLGLALSKSLMEAMGGSLGLEQEPAPASAPTGDPHPGATFWLELPLSRDFPVGGTPPLTQGAGFPTQVVAMNEALLLSSLRQHELADAAGRANAELHMEVAGRLRTEVALQGALADAQAARRAKDHFLAVLSHELRTPLTPVLMAVRTLTRRRDLPEPVMEALAMISRNVRLEAHFIDDLLDLTRIERGKLEVILAPMDLHEAIRRAVEVSGGDSHAKGQTLTVALDAPAHRLTGDFNRLQQVFWNLLKNAAKFTPDNGAVTVRSRLAQDDDQRIIVEVSDTGIGIEPGVLASIFDPFKQANEGIMRRFGGLGLGLAIAQATVAAHGGTLCAASPGLDAGSTFTVTLPLGIPAKSA